MRTDKPSEQQSTRLIRFHEIDDDYEVAESDPDVRGWGVIGANGTKIGEVEDLIVDTDAMKARYLAVALEDSYRNLDAPRMKLIPVGLATLDEEDDLVLLGGLSMDTLARYPDYDGGPITVEFEGSLTERMPGREEFTSKTGVKFYDHADFDEDRFYGSRRRRETGRDRLH